jgi:chromosomal replication initiation ATPase DnaA
MAIYLMRKYTGAPLKDIGSRFGLSSYSSVSSVIIRIKQVMGRDIKLQHKDNSSRKIAHVSPKDT